MKFLLFKILCIFNSFSKILTKMYKSWNIVNAFISILKMKRAQLGSWVCFVKLLWQVSKLGPLCLLSNESSLIPMWFKLLKKIINRQNIANLTIFAKPSLVSKFQVWLRMDEDSLLSSNFNNKFHPLLSSRV